MATSIYLGMPPVKIVEWIKANYKLKNDYLCFTAEEAGSTIKMIYNSGPTQIKLETSPTGNDNSWTDFILFYSLDEDYNPIDYDGTVITLANVGDKVYFRAKQDIWSFGDDVGNSYFEISGKVSASGNLNTLLNADGSVVDLTGRDYCYTGMFQGCTSLIKAPKLPATTLADYCYNFMFGGCTSLTQAPALPATTLAYGCYV